MNKSSAFVSVLLAVVGFVLFSTKAVLIKLAYQYSVDPVSLLLLRMLFSLPFYVGIWAFHQKKWKKEPLSIKQILVTIFLGLTGYYMASYLDFRGLSYITASLERLILFTYPTIVLILSGLVLKQKISLTQILSILVTYAGLAIIFVDNNGITAGSRSDLITGSLFVFGSAILYATFLTGSNYLVTQIGSLRLTTLSMLVSILAVSLHYLLTAETQITALPYQVYLYGFLMAIFATVIPSFLINEAIKRIGAPNVSIIGSIGPVSTIVLSILVLGDRLTFIQSVGAVVIILGVVIISRKK